MWGGVDSRVFVSCRERSYPPRLKFLFLKLLTNGLFSDKVWIRNNYDVPSIRTMGITFASFEGSEEHKTSKVVSDSPVWSCSTGNHISSRIGRLRPLFGVYWCPVSLRDIMLTFHPSIDHSGFVCGRFGGGILYQDDDIKSLKNQNFQNRQRVLFSHQYLLSQHRRSTSDTPAWSEPRVGAPEAKIVYQHQHKNRVHRGSHILVIQSHSRGWLCAVTNYVHTGDQSLTMIGGQECPRG